jgi:predicted membrane metal-binding protein
MKPAAQTDRRTLRNFGFLFAAVFVIVGTWPVLSGRPHREWALAAAAAFALVGLLVPGVLGPLYRVWMRLGHLLGTVNTKIILFLVWWVIVTPIGLVRRLVGKDPMRRAARGEETYRVRKDALPAKSMERMF